MLYWTIGQYIVCTVLENNKAECGQKVVENLTQKLLLNYGKGFDKASLFRIIKFYREFPDNQIVATLSQQLTWSHFVVLLPIEDETKRNFYAVMCSNEHWSVRTLRERRKSMLFERTAISKKPEETIKNDLAVFQSENKMSPDLFYRDLYILDFLGFQNTKRQRARKSRLRSFSAPKNPSRRWNCLNLTKAISTRGSILRRCRRKKFWSRNCCRRLTTHEKVRM